MLNKPELLNRSGLALMLIIFLTSILSSCNFPTAASSLPASANSPTNPVAETIAVLSQTQVPSPTATPSPTNTVTPSASPTLTETMTATNTPMPASLTPNQYMVIASGSAANIRRGPGLAYNSTGGLLKNASTTVYGRNTDGSWIYVAIPGQPGTFGWVTALPQYVTVSVNVMNLPLIPYSQPVPAYIQNCTDHTLLVNPGSIAITDHTRKQFYPNDYQIYDEN
ncbi:MAG TPA: hypothetical protein VKF38_01975, partial [Anaerolineaceae bacterium]|nr:hypothetical protein [Anaerolineaceae bacterium]